MAKLPMAHASRLGQKMDVSSSYAKILGKQIFSLGSFPEVSQKQDRKERKKVGNNNGQLKPIIPIPIW